MKKERYGPRHPNSGHETLSLRASFIPHHEAGHLADFLTAELLI